jgi:predicted dehydrogenase
MVDPVPLNLTLAVGDNDCMPAKVRWGVLGAANIALTKVIPGMQRAANCEVAAIASRDYDRAVHAAQSLGIGRAYESYSALLDAPDIDAVYIPLPNHLHMPWSIQAMLAGKHVLCEKPIALTAAECRRMIEVRDRQGVRAGEAFMVHSHPQWLRARDIARSGGIGDVRAIQGFFSYYNADPENVRNIPDYGGGALMDIGCYPITMSRWMLGREPQRVLALVERDPAFGTDRLISAVLDFGACQSAFTASTQMTPYQRMQFLGTRGRIEVEIPFNAPPDRPTRLLVDAGGGLFGEDVRAEEIPVCDQYTLQGEAFSRSILEGTPVPTPLEDSLANMAVIEALVRSEKSGRWERPER